jgi:predicted  nucleic acid-binding Zn-ribbon protein
MAAVTTLTGDVSEIMLQLQALSADIAERAAESDTADTINAQSSQNRDNAVTAVEQVRQALDNLDPTNSSRVEELRQQIDEVRAQYESVDLSGIYQTLLRRIQEQRETRQSLEAELEGLSGEIRHLRQVSSVLPTGCNGET